MSTLGILGGGQLGAMLARAARRLGVEPLVVDPKSEAPAGRVAEQLLASFDDTAALGRLADCEVVTVEQEALPAEALRWLAERVPLRPPARAVEVASDRLREKRTFRSLDIATVPFEPVDTLAGLETAIGSLGLPAVLKTRRNGYDGRGQQRIETPDEVEAAWRRLGRDGELILEQFSRFDRELSMIAVRSASGEVGVWPLAENTHVHGILRLSRAPAPEVSLAVGVAVTALEKLLAELEYVGVLAVEFFQVGETLLANEMAPRVHNSGHWTLEGAATSQFENHVRAVMGWSLGDTRALHPTAMVNLIGTLPEVSRLVAVPGAHVEIYGKSAAPGRKLGHVNLRAETESELDGRLASLARAIGDPALDGALATRTAGATG